MKFVEKLVNREGQLCSIKVLLNGSSLSQLVRVSINQVYIS